MLVRMGSTPVWRISMGIISTPTTPTSLVVPIRAYKRLKSFAILSIASFLLDLNIKPPRYMNTSQRGTSSQTNTWTTLMHSGSNHGLSLSEVDLGDLEREITKYGPSLMEVNW